MPETDWFPAARCPTAKDISKWNSPPAKPRSRATACWDGNPRNRAAASCAGAAWILKSKPPRSRARKPCAREATPPCF